MDKKEDHSFVSIQVPYKITDWIREKFGANHICSVLERWIDEKYKTEMYERK